jgi:predicted SnoaL-like aldol condensation-catalyzing enzyme
LKGFIAYLRKNAPQSHFEFKKVFADGDYVILHMHAVFAPGTRGQAIVDIFKVDNGKIIEHWDVIQDIPEKPANGNTMF